MRWAPAPTPDPTLTTAIAAEAGLSPLVAAIVARRVSSLDEARRWLTPEQTPLCAPFAFAGMETAADRLLRAIADREPITVFGDYDVDGITATALLVQALAQIGATVKPFIPDRETEGYGLTRAALERCLAYAPRPSLLVTVDCGITCREEVAWLRGQGVDVLITDHHTPPAHLPDAVAIVNPRLSAPPGAEGLCGCAVALTLVRALAARGLPLTPEAFLDLAAVATIADVMALTGENRLLVAQGLRALARPTANPGLRALADAQRLPLSPTAEQIAFGLVPCVNAAGRLGRLKLAYGLIGLRNPTFARPLVALNEERRRIERDILDRILRDAPHPSGNLLLVAGEDFHPGVLGIVAARLVDRFALPTALVRLTPDGGGHGSMRACPPWDAVRALDTVADLLAAHGGHAGAAGFALRPGAYADFARRLPEAFPQTESQEEPTLFEADLTHLPITLTLCHELERLEPYGHGNHKPIFRKDFTLDAANPIGADGSHLRLALRPIEGGNPLKAVWFGNAKAARGWRPGLRLRAWFTLAIDTFREPVPNLILADAQPI